MFDKKPTVNQPDPTVSVETIPTAFYGGNDPVIYHEPESVEQKNPAPVAARLITQPIQKQPTIQKSMTSPTVPKPIGHTNRSKKLFIIFGAVLFLLIVGGSWWWFTGRSTPVAIVIEPAPVAPVFSEPEPIEPEPTIPEASTSTIPDETAKPASLAPIPLDFPSIVLADSGDEDTDSLTDSEEELLGTDSGVWDTDKDGYYDGQEVSNLYNPTGFAPVKIIDSGLVKEYINPTWQYRLYYPATWEVGAVDSAANQLLISSVGGDYIEVRAMPKINRETFFEWFARVPLGQAITDVQQTKNRFEELLWIRKDNLVGYIDQEFVVYVILYHPGADGPVAYRHMMQMLLQSFRPSKTLISLPEQVVLPTPPAVTDIVASSTTSTSG